MTCARFHRLVSSFSVLALLIGLAAPRAVRAEASWVHEQPAAGDFPLAPNGAAAPILYAQGDFAVVGIAARDLAGDVAAVTGRPPAVTTNAADVHGPAVIVGTVGTSATLDQVIRATGFDVSRLQGAWESFVIATVAHPLPGVPEALVVAGSDRRGTAYGVYEISQAIGVSPWHWWADVPPRHHASLYVSAGLRRFGPPSVKYRGIFINDEDWGLEPWVAKTFDPERGNFGPKTYRKVFDLLLRLRANTLWPAMHACSTPFNAIPENAALADEYGIVMGSSHAEPMLRNNVGEWKAAPDTYNYATNREGVRAYWEERIKTNGRFENIYTIGMRGIHDSAMQGPKGTAARVRILEQIFADQRELLAQYARPSPEPGATGAAGPASVPQLFCAYKEVLGLYRGGLKVPDDVTVMFPDDNFGYIRDFPQPDERGRAGGFGIYYHVSYLGAPMSYIWLCTTPPALIAEEMTRAYDHGIRQMWILNVGDLKPAESDTEFFLDLAWDITRGQRDRVADYLPAWAARQFGPEHATEIAAIMDEYYRLNFQRKPEHLQWWLPKQPPRPSPFTPEETAARLDAFRALRRRADAVAASLPAAQRDAFFELVGYPVAGTALANDRYFDGEQSAFATDRGEIALATRLADKANGANAALIEQTRIYNDLIAGGKWRHIMSLEPADGQWKSFRIAPWRVPTFALPASAATATGPEIAREAGHFTRAVAGKSVAWSVIPGLGLTGDSVGLFPTTAAAIPADRLSAEAPRLEYAMDFPAAGDFPVTFYTLPTHPISVGRPLQLAVGLDDAAPRPVIVHARDGSAEWAQGVLDETIPVTTTIHVDAPGRHTLRVYGVEPGIILDKLVVNLGSKP
ncbi:MAG TPA: glycosyl hydrolase 115 family protein [Opitutaceae bacterium]|nr:glycosyl hydrolase 115 family protein [Opitutaceae bacterium]